MSIRNIALFCMLALLACLSSIALAAPTKAERMIGIGKEEVTLNAEENRYLELLNAERKAEGLGELTLAPLLVKIAREKSREMHDLNYWGHESPVKEKRTAMYRVLYYLPERPKTMAVGENLCMSGHVITDEGHKALMNSPTHRKNIMNPKYRYVGIGSYIADDGRFWLTQIFLDINY